MVKHTCHFPGCPVEVRPALWGCKKHWMSLPKRLRDAVWREFRPGQEIFKNPSGSYVAVAKEVHEWCMQQIRKQPPNSRLTQSAQDATKGEI